jgi:uncharacterized membrane protein
MSRTPVRRTATAVLAAGLAFGVTLVAGVAPASAAPKVKSGTTTTVGVVDGATLNGATLNGATLNGATLNGGSLDGATLNGVTLNGVTLN